MRAVQTWSGSASDFGRVEQRIVIDRPIEQVWAFANDQFNRPRWSGGGNLDSRQTSPGPMGLGSILQSRIAIPILGYETRVDAVITEWDPPHAMTVSGSGPHSGPFRSLTSRLTLETVPEGTLVVRTADATLRGAFRVVWLVLGPLVKRVMLQRDNLGKLKELVEGAPR
jgi:carbon monoxide dehydrogenase subunit G